MKYPFTIICVNLKLPVWSGNKKPSNYSIIRNEQQIPN